MTQKAVLITGGTSGIGRATAEILCQQGYSVIVTGRNPDGVASAQRELGDQALVLRADSASREDTERLVEEVRDRFGSLHGIFLNAGISESTPLGAVTEEDWDRIFDINAKGQFFTLQSALPLLADGASVVFTVGVGVKRGIPGGSVASASRGALLAMMPSLAVELAPKRIRVNAVSPGAINTPIWSRSGLPAEQVDQILASMAERIPLGRVGEAEDIASTVAFLVSDGAAYVTGQHIVVGGGIDIA